MSNAKTNKIMFWIRRHPKFKAVVAPFYRIYNKLLLRASMKKTVNECLLRVESITDGNIKRVWHFGYPVQRNLGDLAQGCCIDKWLAEEFSEYETVIIENESFYFASKALLPLLKAKIKKSDLIIFQSGYTMHDKHHDSKTHIEILNAFPDNKTVFFPQTIMFKNRKEISAYKNAMSNHKHLLLICRDKVSYDYASEMFGNVKKMCFPDIVATRIGEYNFENERNGILICVRDDAERKFSPAEIESLAQNLSEFGKTNITDTTVSFEVSHIWDAVMNCVKNYSEYKLIVTDRYHGTIFSLMASTPVVVLPTNDHKVISGAQWLEGVYPDYVSIAKDIADAEVLARNMLKESDRTPVAPYFKAKYYDKLAAYINDEL